MVDLNLHQSILEAQLIEKFHRQHSRGQCKYTKFGKNFLIEEVENLYQLVDNCKKYSNSQLTNMTSTKLMEEIAYLRWKFRQQSDLAFF